MEPIIDVMIYLVIFGGAVIVCSVLVFGIYRMIRKIQTLDRQRKRRETVSAINLYTMVQRRVPRLTPVEYDRAVQYVIRKYHMAGLHIDCQRSEYIAELIAETVGQDKLSRGTLDIAEADRELDDEIIESQIKEGEQTA